MGAYDYLWKEDKLTANCDWASPMKEIAALAAELISKFPP